MQSGLFIRLALIGIVAGQNPLDERRPLFFDFSNERHLCFSRTRIAKAGNGRRIV